MTRILNIALTTFGTVLAVAFPFFVYFGMSHLDIRTLSLLLLALFLPIQLLRLRGKKREHLKALLPMPLGVVGLLLLAAVINDHRFVLALPVLVNLVILAGFATSLRAGAVPTVERFARMRTDDLSRKEIAHCRGVTIIWCLFLASNALVTLGLALFAPISWWTIYAGGIAYGLMGLLFAGEFVVRKIRFPKEQSVLQKNAENDERPAAPDR